MGTVLAEVRKRTTTVTQGDGADTGETHRMCAMPWCSRNTSPAFWSRCVSGRPATPGPAPNGWRRSPARPCPGSLLSSAARSGPAATGCAGGRTELEWCGEVQRLDPKHWGDQPANVLLTVKKDKLAAHGAALTAAELAEAFKRPTLENYAHENCPQQGRARLSDGGIIDPADTRMLLGLGIAASLDAPLPKRRVSVFRM